MQYTLVSDFLKQWPAIPWLMGAVVLGLLLHFLLFKIAQFLARRTESDVDDSFVKHCRAPARLILPLLFLNFAFPLIKLPHDFLAFSKQIVSAMLTVALAWLMIRLIHVLEDYILGRYRLDVEDNLKARQIRTQLQILKRMAAIIVMILALAVILMSFDKVRQLGTSILASAGIASVIVGLAARQPLAALLSGIQIAITQPIRIDDVVVVENQWGRVEEIALTYVVIRIWDLRRLVVPITYLLEKPVENWTRTSSNLLGTVFLYVDYTVPVQAVREELHRILNSTDRWDGSVWSLQVTNATDHTVELRALMSAADSSRAFELRCIVREKLIEFLQKNYPHALPRVRAEIKGGGIHGETEGEVSSILAHQQSF